MPVSKVQLLRENIANEYMAAQWGMSGLAYGTPQHAFVTARMERMGGEHKQLADLVGDSQAARMFSETLETLPEHPERNAVSAVIRHFRGNSEQTEQMLDWIKDAWDTFDLLRQTFGEEDAQKILFASH